MIYAYLRYSTSHQDEIQQVQALKEWAGPRGITIDEFVKDEGISGGVSYRDRNLYGLVKRLKPGDILICSEVSRLGRSMHDISDLLSNELKPRKIRLVVIKMGIDVDCAHLTAPDEFIFAALSFAAQVEKDLLQSRTQSALDARKELIKRDGGFVSKAGNYVKHLGREKGCDTTVAVAAAGRAHTNRATKWRNGSTLYLWVTNQVLKGRSQKDILAEALENYETNPAAWSTRNGKALCQGTLSRWVKEIRI